MADKCKAGQTYYWASLAASSPTANIIEQTNNRPPTFSWKAFRLITANTCFEFSYKRGTQLLLHPLGSIQEG
jgi:hypothetical protein